MKLELCNYSGYKIYPGHGKRYIRLDGKVFNFLNKKSANALLMRRNPRKVPWTVLYRRKHKKGTQEEISKKRTRRNVKFQRSIQGATMENILAKRNQKPEMRKAQREQAIRAAKEKQRAKDQQKKALKISCSECSQTYIGETSRNTYMRGREHLRELDNRSKGSVLWSHAREEHEGKIPDYTCDVTNVFQGDALLRQVSEAVLINKVKPEMNTKKEWNFANIPRARIN
ncbi:60S ribosomal protein L24 [Exaiptasia diaphana]|nr:60S ribosomal protein L24 [Exaiptasia diaphana]